MNLFSPLIWPRNCWEGQSSLSLQSFLKLRPVVQSTVVGPAPQAKGSSRLSIDFRTGLVSMITSYPAKKKESKKEKKLLVRQSFNLFHRTYRWAVR